MAADAVPDPQSAAPGRRFGIRFGALGLVLPAEVPARFHVGVRVFPVPRAMPRLLGLMNLDGLPTPVFRVDGDGRATLPTLAERDVLVVGTAGRAIGLSGCGAPQPLSLVRAQGRRPAPGQDPLNLAREAMLDPDSGEPWFTFSVEALTDALVTLLPAGQDVDRSPA